MLLGLVPADAQLRTPKTLPNDRWPLFDLTQLSRLWTRRRVQGRPEAPLRPTERGFSEGGWGRRLFWSQWPGRFTNSLDVWPRLTFSGPADDAIGGSTLAVRGASAPQPRAFSRPPPTDARPWAGVSLLAVASP